MKRLRYTDYSQRIRLALHRPVFLPFRQRYLSQVYERYYPPLAVKGSIVSRLPQVTRAGI